MSESIFRHLFYWSLFRKYAAEDWRAYIEAFNERDTYRVIFKQHAPR